MGMMGKGFAAVFACLLAIAVTPHAFGGTQKAGAFAREYAETLPPIGFVEFCQRNPDACEAGHGKQRKVAMNQEKWLLVRMVNAFVNGAIAPITDETLYGTPEYWTLPADAGEPGDDVFDVLPLRDEVIEFENVSKSFGDRVLIDNLSFKVPAGAIVGIIGPNGAGKSTLFKLIAGKEQPDSGEVKIGQTVRMAFVDQNRDDLNNDKTVWEDVSGGLDILNVGKFQMASRAYCGRFNFNGGDQQKKVGMLSGGERGRLHLAKTLIAGGNVLLLDEPSNDLDVETLRALEDALLEFAGSVMVISHDRWFLDRIATHILAAEGDSQWVFFDGNYQEYEADKKRRLGEEGAKPKRVRFKALK